MIILTFDTFSLSILNLLIPIEKAAIWRLFLFIYVLISYNGYRNNIRI